MALVPLLKSSTGIEHYVLMLLNGRAFTKAAIQVGKARYLATLIMQGQRRVSTNSNRRHLSASQGKVFPHGCSWAVRASSIGHHSCPELQRLKRLLAIFMLTRIPQIKMGWEQRTEILDNKEELGLGLIPARQCLCS